MKTFFKLDDILITLAILLAIELTAILFAVGQRPAVAAAWHFAGIFVNLMIVGGIAFRQVVFREIGRGLIYKDDNALSYRVTPLSSWLLRAATLSAVLMAASHFLAPLPFFRAWPLGLPFDAELIFGWPILASAGALLVLALTGLIKREDTLFDIEEALT